MLNLKAAYVVILLPLAACSAFAETPAGGKLVDRI